MKLELKHLAGYLPYGLKFVVAIHEFYQGAPFENRVLTMNQSVSLCLKHGKPILRPLSDLTKKIEHNGEKFVPSIDYSYHRFHEISTFKGGSRHINFLHWSEIQQLLEWHFDIYGLIEKGLAIDINTLNQQS